jgi:serine/threonine-protein kinase
MVERFRQEAVTVANLQHAHIIAIHAVRQVEDLHFFVMQFVPGRTIEGVMREHGALPIPVTLAWLYQVGSALGYAHRRGVIHRDVKPGNILLGVDGEAIVTDFGIAKVTENPALTQTGAVVGTPRYMSPEQCYAKELTGASDQYSLAIVAYEMLAGRPPFSGSSFALMRAHTDDPPPPLRELRPDVPEDVEAAIMRMLAKRPEQRFPTLGAALAALGAAPLTPADPLHATLQELAAANERLDNLRDVLRTPASPIPRTRERARSSHVATPETPRPAVEPITVAIGPPPTDLEPGATATLHAAVKTASGQTAEHAAVSWESGDTNVALIDPATGVLTALEPGRTTVTALVGTARDSTEIVVGQPRVAKEEIAPQEARVEVSRTVTLSAVVTSRVGSVLQRHIEWSVDHPSLAAIARDTTAPTPGSVVVRGLAPGATRVLASCDGALALARLTVVAAPEPVAPKPPKVPSAEPEWPARRVDPVSVRPGAPPVPTPREPVEAVTSNPPQRVTNKPVTRVPEALVPPAQAAPAAKLPPPDDAPNATVVLPSSARAASATPRRPDAPPPAVREPAVGASAFAPTGDAAIARETGAPTLPTPPAVPEDTKPSRRAWRWAAPVVLVLGVAAYLIARGSFPSAAGDSASNEPPPSVAPSATDSTRAQAPGDSAAVAPASPNVPVPPPRTAAATDSAPRPTATTTPSPAAPAAPVARRVQLAPSRTDAILPGQSIAITATVRDQAGKTIRNAPVRWSSSDPAVATVDPTGKVVGVAQGTARISAVSGTASEVVSVSVNPPPPDPAVVVAVEFADISPMTAGDSVRLSAVPRNALGNTATGATISWTSSNPEVAVVSPGGVLVARSAGSSTITASSGGRSAEHRATVRAREVVAAPKADTPAAPPPKSEAELRAEIRAVLARYSRGIETRDTALMRAVFPSAPGELLKNWQVTFDDARDGIQLSGPEIDILDTPRDVLGSQVRASGQRNAKFYSKRSRRDVELPTRFTAVLQRVANGWRIMSIR